jgi:hypothetical protein
MKNKGAQQKDGGCRVEGWDRDDRHSFSFEHVVFVQKTYIRFRSDWPKIRRLFLRIKNIHQVGTYFL